MNVLSKATQFPVLEDEEKQHLHICGDGTSKCLEC